MFARRPSAETRWLWNEEQRVSSDHKSDLFRGGDFDVTFHAEKWNNFLKSNIYRAEVETSGREILFISVGGGRVL